MIPSPVGAAVIRGVPVVGAAVIAGGIVPPLLPPVGAAVTGRDGAVVAGVGVIGGIVVGTAVTSGAIVGYGEIGGIPGVGTFV